MARRAYPFVDWMKALGMIAIVYGHVAHATTVALTPPIYLKQLGVALFLFATGFTLARERRGTVEAVLRRLFSVYLFGIGCAALVALTGWLTGTGMGLSNFFPFAGGVNVLFDNFPANPTTWYVGTYVHLLVLWAIWLRRLTVRVWMIAAALALEIPVRALLMAHAGGFIAYMLMTNWLAVFLLGLARGAEHDEPRGAATPYAVALVVGLVGWTIAMRPFAFEPTFPFMSMPGWPPLAAGLLVSAGASILYLWAPALMFEATRRVAAPSVVRFVARNSLIIFLAHMPVFFALRPLLLDRGIGYWPQVIVQLIVCVGGLGILSELIHRALQPDRLRARLIHRLSADPHRAAGTHVGPVFPRRA